MIGKLKSQTQKILNDPFWKNVATLFTGTAIAQALPILIFPVLTRMYTKEAIGFYFIYAAVGMILQIISSLQYQLAIIIPKSKKEADTIFELSLYLVFIISTIVFIIISLFFNFISSFIVQKDFISWLYAIPISTFFLGIFRVSNFYLNRIKAYKIISVGKVIKTLVFTVLQIVFGLVGYLKSGLILSLILGQAISGLYLLFVVVFVHKFSFSFNLNAILDAIKKYKDMPIYNTTVAAISAISTQLPLFFLSRYFGVGYTSDYGLSNRIVSSPMELLGTSIGQVFNQESAEIVNKKGNLYNLVKTMYLRLFKIAIVPFAILFAVSYWLFPIIFGEQYQASGIITMILVPWLFLHFLNSPQSFLFNVLHKQKFMTVFHTLFLLSRLLVLFAGYYFFNNVYVSVGLFSLVGIAFNVYLITFYLKISKKTKEEFY